MLAERVGNGASSVDASQDVATYSRQTRSTLNDRGKRLALTRAALGL